MVKVVYSESFLDGLCSSWITREEAMRLLQIDSVSTFRYHVQNDGIRRLVIGQASLVRGEDVMRSLRSRGN